MSLSTWMTGERWRMKLSDMTALYTHDDLEYSRVMSGPYEDLSVISEDVVVIAAYKAGQISGYWRPVIAFGEPTLLKLHIERLWDESQDIVYEDYLIDGHLSVVSQFLLRHGYVATPHYTQVIDLRQSEEELHAGLRKSYPSLVNKTDDVEQTDVWGVFETRLRQGGNARSRNSWAIQARMPTVCYRRTPHRAAVMFYYGPSWAYYASACGDDTHPLIWQSLLELKRRGVSFCEMGTQQFAGDAKLVGIAKYKRGFGGATQVRLILRRKDHDAG